MSSIFKTHDFSSEIHSLTEHAHLLRRSTAEERIAKLLRLQAAILKMKPDIEEALEKDFGKVASETALSEIFPTLKELGFAIKNTGLWMKPRKVRSPLALLGSRSEIHYEPKGVVLVISPWNYPFSLALNPIIAAVAAGNSIALKPSEFTPNVNQVIDRILSETFSKSEVRVFHGDAKVAESLLQHAWDHIFFTGSTRIGKVIALKAAEHLTPVTLELGGKSPAIVDATANLTRAARRIAWGKFINAGQTCVAPDFLWVHRSVLNDFISKLKNEIETSYVNEPGGLAEIISEPHAQRLQTLLSEAKSSGAQIIRCLEPHADRARWIAPRLVLDVSPQARLLQEEIFGPVLPILPFDQPDDIENAQRSLPKPLALYVFSNDPRALKDWPLRVSSGGVTLNGTLMHLLNPRLPFGGTRDSGLGSYHGEFGFKTFSHERAVLRQGIFSSTDFLRPPYTPKVRYLIDMVLKFLP